MSLDTNLIWPDDGKVSFFTDLFSEVQSKAKAGPFRTQIVSLSTTLPISCTQSRPITGVLRSASTSCQSSITSTILLTIPSPLSPLQFPASPTVPCQCPSSSVLSEPNDGRLMRKKNSL